MKTVIEMAREAAAVHGHTFKAVPSPETIEFITAFAELVRADERARLAEQPAQRTWKKLTDAETEHLWEISRAAIPRYHTFKTLIEKALRERNT